MTNIAVVAVPLQLHYQISVKDGSLADMIDK